MFDTFNLVEGNVIITNAISSFRNADIYIRLEDVSRADAEAIILATQTINNVEHTATENGQTKVPFKIYLGKNITINPKNLYGVRVLIDIKKGTFNRSQDLTSDQSYPVLTHGYGNFIEIKF